MRATTMWKAMIVSLGMGAVGSVLGKVASDLLMSIFSYGRALAAGLSALTWLVGALCGLVVYRLLKRSWWVVLSVAPFVALEVLGLALLPEYPAEQNELRQYLFSFRVTHDCALFASGAFLAALVASERWSSGVPRTV